MINWTCVDLESAIFDILKSRKSALLIRNDIFKSIEKRANVVYPKAFDVFFSDWLKSLINIHEKS